MKTNGADMMARARRADTRGSNAGNSKLTWPVVRAIRRAYADGRPDQRILARQYGVVQSTISSIIRGETWVE